MEFLYNESDSLTMKDYFKKYKDDLPHLVIVTGGHYGMTVYDDFPTDQVIRFHTYSTQRRVIARVSTEARTCNLEFYNIPVDEKYRFRVVRGWQRVGPVETMDQILPRFKTEGNKIKPFLVQFADIYRGVDSTYFINDECVPLDFLIMKDFEENYLLGNCLDNGVISEKVTIAALSSNIYVANVTGIKGKDEKEFVSYLNSLENIVRTKTKFDRRTGSPAITKIQHDSPDTGTGASISPDEPLIPIEDIYPGMNEEAPPLPPSRDGYMRLSAEVIRQYSRSSSNEEEPYSKLSNLPQRESSASYNRPTADGEDKVLYTFPRQHSDPMDAMFSDHVGVSNLSVRDICNSLKMLNLDKYISKFEDQKVDGALLQELDKVDLMEIFHLKPDEAERMLHFAKNGFIVNL